MEDKPGVEECGDVKEGWKEAKGMLLIEQKGDKRFVNNVVVVV